MKNSRDELAQLIRNARSVSIENDPNRDYRRCANECRKGIQSYNKNFGIGKAPKRRIEK